MAWEEMESFCGRTFWDSNLTWHTNSPEFTWCFEQTFLVWFPLICLWLFTPLDIYFTLHTRQLKIPWNYFNLTKIVSNILLIFLVLIDLVYNVKTFEELYPVLYWTPIFQILTYILSLVLTILHVKRGHCSSGSLFLFWALSVLMNSHSFRSDIRAFQTDSYILVNITDTISYIITIFLVLLNLFADKAVHDPNIKEPDKILPLNFSSALSRFTMSWYDKMAILGFRRPLVMSDLWNLSEEMKSQTLVNKFEIKWNTVQKKQKSKGKEHYVSAVIPAFRVLLPDFLLTFFLRLLADLFGFGSPLILKHMLAFIKTEESNWKGFFFAILLVLTSIVQSCLAANGQLLLYHFGIKLKNSLVGAIFKKCLRLSNDAKAGSSFGEIVNIMSLDCDKIMEAAYYSQFVLLAPLQIIITFVLLWQMMGPAVIAGFSIMIILLPINWFFSKKIHAIQTKQMSTKDNRVKAMNEILSGIKVLKLNAWEHTFEKQINDFRGKETNNLKQMAYLSSTMSCFWSCATCFMMLSTFAVYVLSDENNVLDIETAFTSISLFNMLFITMFLVPHFINYISQAVVSINRINKYMNSEELDMSSVTHHNENEQLIMEKCNFKWENDGRLILKDISVSIKPGSLVAIVGPVGSGKSSLISAFLGEMYKVSGIINTMGKMAYVPQVAWIQNDTVQGNILFGKNYVGKKYKRVVESCCLLDDFEMLPAGDKTEIGEKGINLSGGQKQRVSLARAVYYDSDVYFLDDPLSAVDTLVGKHIFEHVIGPRGLLRKKTRLIATHLVSYLPDTDYIIVLKDGEISALGTYNELMASNNSFKDLILNHSNNQNYQEDNDIDDGGVPGNESTPFVKKDMDRQNSLGRQSVTSDMTTSTVTLDKGKSGSNGGLVEAEHAETGQVNLQVFRNYIKAMGVNWWITIVACCFIRQGFSIGGNYWISIWSNDQTLISNGTLNTSKRDMYLGVYGAIIFFQAISSYLSDIIPLIACLKAAIFLHTALLKAIFRAPLAFFDTTPLGRIISRFTKDIDALDSLMPPVMTQSVNFIAELIGIVFVISYSSPLFLLIMIPIGFLYYFIRKFYILSSTQIRRLVSITRSPIYSHFSETLSGAFVIRAFKEEDRFVMESQDKVDHYTKAYYTATVANRWLSVRLETLGNIIIFFAAISAVLTREDSNAGIIGLSLTYSLMVTRVLLLLMRFSADTELHIVAAERVKEYTNVEQEKPWDLPINIPKSWPDRGEIVFKDFSFRYRKGLDLVLKSISFSIQPGEKVGIVGRSGAGKSSLTLSLFRIIESAGGSILIDGVDISTLGLHRLRQNLNIISQDPVLFSGSLRLNLDPQSKYSDDDLWKSLELAHLKPFVSTLPSGLQHEISEGGGNLSAGQRQQVCLARALLNKTKILIMDEATAAIDLETDELIQRTIRSEFSNCTVLTIAHRINTILDSDRVLVLDSGVIAEYDTPNKLLSNPDSLFSALASKT